MMRIDILSGAVAFFVVLSAVPCARAEDEAAVVTCPPRLPAGAVSARSPGAGWVAAVEFPASLTSMGIFRGPPDEREQIMPEWPDRIMSEHVDRYRFDGTDDEKTVWVQCTYAGATVSLSHPISGHPRVCAAHYRKDADDVLVFAETRCR